MPIIGVVASGISGRLSVPTGYYSIATATVTSGGAPSITFSSIPTSYTHLELRWTAGDDRPTESMDDIIMQFNGDSNNANYKNQRLYTKGTSVSADSVDGYGCAIGWGSAAGRTNSNVMGMGIATIPDYKSTKKKTVTAFSGMNNAPINTGQAGGNQNFGSIWHGTSPINEIKISGVNGNFVVNSVFHLYGMV